LSLYFVENRGSMSSKTKIKKTRQARNENSKELPTIPHPNQVAKFPNEL
jgi:hypothetical protein